MMNFDKFSQIAYLGPEGSFSEMAKDIFCEKFEINAHPVPMATIKHVADFIQNSSDTLGVLPIENSIFGTVRETLYSLMNFSNQNIHILAETVMPIQYCLLSRTTELYSISGIIAEPHALAKCNEFVKHELPMNLNIVEAATAPEAARLLEGYNLTYASIGTEKLAKIYNLNILKKNIDDEKSNRTNFVLIGDMETQITNKDKTTLMFRTANKPGALMEILNIFYESNINLSYISSHPTKDEAGEYIFVVSFDGHIKDSQVQLAVSHIQNTATYMKYLGSYEI